MIKVEDQKDEAEEPDTIKSLINRYKSSDMFRNFASMKPFEWNIVKVPMLFFYIVIVAQSGEITVKCRSISGNFENASSVSLFVFFEMEVFASAGILLGLWLWLTSKYFLNAIYHNGP